MTDEQGPESAATPRGNTTPASEPAPAPKGEPAPQPPISFEQQTAMRMLIPDFDQQVGMAAEQPAINFEQQVAEKAHLPGTIKIVETTETKITIVEKSEKDG